MALAVVLSTLARADEPKIVYQAPVVGAGIFSDQLAMMDQEREEYALNLANYAANHLVAQKASAESLEQTRRLLALSLHLSPRNRKAVVMNFQLGKGILPQKVEGDYSSEVLARLLLTRGQLLVKQAAEEDQLLGRCFIEIAAEMDPRNEDAVYAAELLRLDQKKVDWKSITDVKVSAPEWSKSEQEKQKGKKP
ncbi:MAG: hypothetical protein RLZZ224_116 [Verrucomicrobiota bacterium]|jgi:hypothetical protein